VVREPTFLWQRQASQEPRLAEIAPRWLLGDQPPLTVIIACIGAEPAGRLLHSVIEDGIAYRIVRMGDVANTPRRPDGDISALLLDWTDPKGSGGDWLDVRFSQGFAHPTIAVVTRQQLDESFGYSVDDFIVWPWAPGELAMRIWRLGKLPLEKTASNASGVIQEGDLTIDTNKYDVVVAGRSIVLTFKEYELLKLLASHPGRVFSRETLLEQVWGYEYFGGTRTVDVHVRRVRSKTDDATHSFIDTVWNVGYRFRA